ASIEDDCFVPVEEDAVRKVPSHSAAWYAKNPYLRLNLSCQQQGAFRLELFLILPRWEPFGRLPVFRNRCCVDNAPVADCLESGFGKKLHVVVRAEKVNGTLVV